MLDEARKTFSDLGLCDRIIIEAGGGASLLTWSGDWTNEALAILLSHVGLPSNSVGLVIEVQGDALLMMDKLAQVAHLENLSTETVLADVENMQREKWDWVLPPSLLMSSYASMCLDLEAARSIARQITE
ncbi:hypothetical protein D3C75_990450 [compost metagenome]